MDSPSVSKDTVQFDATYLLGEPGNARAFRAELMVVPGEEFALTRGELVPRAPVGARWAMGRSAPDDVIWTTVAAPVLISGRVKTILEQERVSGWRTYALDLRGKGGDRIDGYYGLSVNGRCGPVDNRRSRETLKEYPGGTFPVWKGMFFDENTWDGADIFMPAGDVGWIFVVDRVRELLQRVSAKLLFTPLTQIERMML